MLSKKIGKWTATTRSSLGCLLLFQQFRRHYNYHIKLTQIDIFYYFYRSLIRRFTDLLLHSTLLVPSIVRGTFCDKKNVLVKNRAIHFSASHSNLKHLCELLRGKIFAPKYKYFVRSVLARSFSVFYFSDIWRMEDIDTWRFVVVVMVDWKFPEGANFWSRWHDIICCSV